ncbi:hypothetical protein LVQ78_10295 [Buttiauxella sp. A2-C2_NF]|uniref:hypothetical protein n=1 Tax=Buttiauxella ferragutiae TaxID=82989 RepID=UPI001E6389E9|nr:hypothetical protein [Buttiauxella ferragutiae]MCE0826418.1 hypothetical protein [Buttiauxella ferragutiae]
MDVVKIKGIASSVFIIAFTTSMIVFICNEAGTDTLSLIKGEGYIVFDWKQIPVLLFIPAMILFDLCALCMLIPICRKKTNQVMQKLLIPLTIYCVAVFIIGSIVSMIISVFVLGANYYKCDSTSIVSSGSHYAKSKEMCKAREYSIDSEGETQK